jgi:hypothetical protein
MRTFIVTLILGALVFVLAACQTTCSKGYEGPRKDSSAPDGYYVPRDLDDALIEMDRIMGSSGRADVLKIKEDEMVAYHYSIGLWMRNNWLRHHSRLGQYFRQLGIYEYDDMSGIILNSYWRQLHGKPIDLNGQVRYYQDYWKNEDLKEGK